MKKIEHLTQEIKNKIPEYISKVRDKLYSGEEHSTNKRSDTVKYIEEIYKIAGQKKPVVIIAKNPEEYKVFFSLLKKRSSLVSLIFKMKNNLYSELRSELNSELGSELDSELHSELCSELRSELYSELCSELNSELNSELGSELDSELRSELRSELFSELYSELHSELGSELDSELHSELRSELGSELYSELDSELYSELRSELCSRITRSHWLFLCSIYSRVYLTWYMFIQKEFNIQTTKKKELEYLYELVNKTFIARCFFTKGYVLVLKTPKRIIRNERGFHSVKTAAIKFEGGYNMYY